MLPLQALDDTRHLIEHHSSLVAKGVAALVAAVLPAVDALRSQTAHAALLTLQARPPSGSTSHSKEPHPDLHGIQRA